MFKVLVLALCCIYAESKLREEAYKPGREYIYKYETQIATGLPGASATWSAVKVKALARVQIGDRSAKLQLDGIRLFRINDLIKGACPSTEIVPDDIFIAMSGAHVELIRQYLSWPVEFSYVDGHVYDLRTEEDEPLWSVNIKRGIVGLFEMNIDSKRTLEDDESNIVMNTPQNPEFRFLRTVEPTPAGECETVYEIQPKPAEGEEGEIFVTKVRDYKKCLDKPEFHRIGAAGWKCPECGPEPNSPITSTARISYNLVGNAKKFIIKRVSSAERHEVAPYSMKKEKAGTYVRQVLVLEDAIPLVRPIPEIIKSTRQPSGIKIDLPEAMDTPQNPFFPEILKEKVRSERESGEAFVVAKIGGVIETLVAMPKTKLEQAPELILRLVHEFRNASEAAVRECVKRFNGNALARPFLWQAIAAAGTRECAIICLEAVAENQIPIGIVPQLMSRLAMSSQPNPIILRKVLAIVNGESQQPPSIVKATWLSLGIWGYKLSKWNETVVAESKKKIITIQRLIDNASRNQERKELRRILKLEQQLFDQTTEIYSRMRRQIISSAAALLQNPDTEVQILGLKALGNAGFMEMIPHIAPLCSARASIPLRIEAIHALRRCAWKAPSQVATVLLPIFLNVAEPYEVRIAAYTTIMQGDPSIEVFQICANALRTERSIQVGAYVYSHLIHYSNTTNPCYLKYAKKAAIALEADARRFYAGWGYSNWRHWSMHLRESNMVDSVDILTIGSESPYVPKAAAVKIQATAGNANAPILEIGYKAEGINEILGKILGPGGSLYSSKSAFDILKRNKRSVGAGEEIVEKIMRTLNIQPRESRQPWGQAYLKYFGHELNYWTLNEEYVKEVVKTGIMGVTFNEEALKKGRQISINKVSALSLADVYLPTGAGLPINIQLEAAYTLIVNGRVAFNVEPSIFSSVRNGQLPVEAGIKVDIKPIFTACIKGAIQVKAPLFEFGAATKHLITADVPIKMAAKFDIKKLKLITEIDVPQNVEPKVVATIEPYTFIKIANIHKPSHPEISIRPITHPVGEKTIQHVNRWFDESTGIAVVREIQTTDIRGITLTPWPLAGIHRAVFYAQPTPAAPKVIEFQAQLALGNKPATNVPGYNEEREVAAQEAENTGIWSSFGSWFPSSSYKGEEEAESPELPSEFHDLKTKDVTAGILAERLNKPVYDPTGRSTFGLAAVLATKGGQKKFRAQFEAIVTPGPFANQTNVALKYKQTPISPAMASKSVGATLNVEAPYAPEPNGEAPFEIVFDANITMPSVIERIESLLRPEHELRIYKEVMEHMSMEDIHAMIHKLKGHFTKWFDRHTSVGFGDVITEQVMVQVLHKMPIANKAILLRALGEQVTIEAELKNLKLRAASPQPIVLKRMADKSANIINILERISVVEHPTATPIVQFLVAKQLKVHQTLRNYASALAAITSNNALAAVAGAVEQQITVQQRRVLQHQIKIIEFLPELHRHEMRELFTSLSPIDITIGKHVQQIELMQAESIKNALQTGPSAIEGSLKAIVEQAETLQNVVIASIENGQIPEERILGKAAMVLLNQKIIIRATLNIDSLGYKESVVSGNAEQYTNEQEMGIYSTRRGGKPLGRYPSQLGAAGDVPKQVLMKLAELELRTKVILKTIPIIVGIAQEKAMVRPVIPNEFRGIFDTLLQVELQQVLLGLRASVALQKPIVVEPTRIVQQAERYLATIPQAVELLKTVLRSVEEGGRVPHPALLIKIIKISTYNHQCINLLKIISETNEVIFKTNLPQLLEKSKYIAAYPSIMVNKIAWHMEPLIHEMAIKAAYGATTPEARMSEIPEIISVQEKLKKRIPVIISKAASPLLIAKEIERVIRECQLVNKKLQGMASGSIILETIPAISRSQWAIAKQQQLEIITTVKTAIERRYDLPQFKSLLRLCIEQEAECKLVDSMAAAKNAGVVRQPSWEPSCAKVVIRGEVAYGFKGSMKQRIIIKAFAHKSAEQLIWELAQTKPLTRDPQVMQFAVEQITGRVPLDIETHMLHRELNMYRELAVIVNWEEAVLSPRMRTWCRRIEDIVAKAFYHKLHTSVPAVAPMEGAAFVKLALSRNNRELYSYIRTPESIKRVSNIIVPEYVARMVNYSPLSGLFVNRTMPFRAAYGNGICQLSGPMMKTFDGASYAMPNMPGCEGVVAMDCSGGSRFAVKLGGFNPLTGASSVTVHAGGHLAVISGLSGAEPSIRVNGAEIAVPVNAPWYLGGSSARPAMSCARMGNALELNVPGVGIAVVAGAGNIQLRTSGMLGGGICGMCGNIDGEAWNDYMGPQMSVWNEPEPFYSRYIVAGPQCNAATYIPNAGIATPIVQGGCFPSPITETIPRTSQNGQKEICFSVDTVRRCPKSCAPAGTIEKAIGFYCANAANPETQTLLKQAMINPLSAAMLPTVSFQNGVTEHIACQPIA